MKADPGPAFPTRLFRRGVLGPGAGAEPREPVPAGADALSLFYSYAHEDEAHRERLERHLAILEKKGFIRDWHDRMIPPGTEWDRAIRDNLEAADLILLLVSAHFVASEYIRDVELRRAMERHEAGSARVIPVVVGPVDWSQSPFAKLQALPTDAKPVSSWRNPDEAFLDVSIGIRRVVEDLLSARSGESAPG